MAARRARELTQLTTRFTRAPQPTLALFYQRTGVPAPAQDGQALNVSQLLADLQELALAAYELPTSQQLILASADDSIVPPELVWDNFASCPQVTVEVLPQGQHALGYSQPAFVVQRIMSFINAN